MSARPGMKMACNKWAAFKLTEFIMCLVCLIYKWVTDEEASRLFYLLEKISREWPLLTNITWNRTGDMFADVTFGSYAIICLGLLISSCSGELGYMRKTETVLLGIGVLMFFGVGCMVLASIDSIPHNLVDNAVILGTLTLLTGLLFLLDMGVTGNRHKSGKGQDAEFRLKRNVQMPLAPSPSVPSEIGVKKIDIPPDAIKPDQTGSYQNGAAAYQNGATAYQTGTSYQNGAAATVVPINQNGFPVNQNGYQNAINQTVAAQGDPALYSRSASDPAGGYVRNGIVDGRNGVTGVSYTNGVKPMGELRSSMKKREMAKAEKERSGAVEGRSTPDGYRMRDDTVAKNEYIQMGKRYTSQDLDLNRELVRKEREKENLELANKYYDQREVDDYTIDKTYVKRRDQDFTGRAADREPSRSHHQYDGYSRRDKLKKQAGTTRLAPDSSEEEDLNDRELSRITKRHRHYDSSDYDDETLQQSQATRKLAQENLQRAHAENKRNYYRQRSADELHYGPAPHQAKAKRSRTPDFDGKWRGREKEAYESKYYHSENEKEEHQEYLSKEKRSLQQWRFSQDLYQDNWRAQIAAQEGEAPLHLPKHWKAPSGGGASGHYGVADIPPPSKFTDAAKYKSEAPARPSEAHQYMPPPPTKFSETKYEAGRHHEVKYEAGKYKSDSDEDSLAQVQIPSVSFLMSERGKKIKPTITPSPIKTITKEISPKDYHRDRDVIEDRIRPQATAATPTHKFFFSEEARGRDSAPTVPAPVTPGSPGFVKQLASNWPQ